MANRLKRRIRMQVRAVADDAAPGSFEAVVSTYELEYEIGWGWTEQIMSGCFTDSIDAHPVIPVYHQHDWDSGPIGSCKPEENGKELVVAGQLYLDVGGDLVARVYQAMIDGALEEWSIGFWAEEITWSDDNPQCDSITEGDLAEASICVRGANPETGTLGLAGRAAWVDGAEADRRTEVNRLRAKYTNLPELNIRDASDPPETEPEPAVAPPVEPETDPADDESSRARYARLMSKSWGRELLARSRKVPA